LRGNSLHGDGGAFEEHDLLLFQGRRKARDQLRVPIEEARGESGGEISAYSVGKLER